MLLDRFALKPDDCDTGWNWASFPPGKAIGEQARQELESARRFNSREPRAALFLGEVLWKLERRSEALASLREAIRLDPRTGSRVIARRTTRPTGDFPAAAEYRAALGLNPANVKAKVECAAVL